MGLQMKRVKKEFLCTMLPEFFKSKECVELAYLFGSTA
jgi:predicted nucleotidyltransferase